MWIWFTDHTVSRLIAADLAARGRALWSRRRETDSNCDPLSDPSKSERCNTPSSHGEMRIIHNGWRVGKESCAFACHDGPKPFAVYSCIFALTPRDRAHALIGCPSASTFCGHLAASLARCNPLLANSCRRRASRRISTPHVRISTIGNGAAQVSAELGLGFCRRSTSRLYSGPASDIGWGFDHIWAVAHKSE